MDNAALIAGPTSPETPEAPVPAKCVIIPLEFTLRIWLDWSAIYRLPAESRATALGRDKVALVAGPLSPDVPKLPLPATVVRAPFNVTLRISSLPWSAMYTLPAASAATPCGKFNCALVATGLSPEKPLVPLPARVEMVPPGVTLRIRWLFWSAMY